MRQEYTEITHLSALVARYIINAAFVCLYIYLRLIDLLYITLKIRCYLIKLFSRRQSFCHWPSARKTQISSKCVFKLHYADDAAIQLLNSGEITTSYMRRINVPA